ncbi:unnamed protein product [Blumeria hordei]|uniref:Uncharacterized protein n=2 Tax=Blumeria hordei TaxID=2867405 RepID=A0A383UVM3_BLUHO|nr:putative candidate secreted effector protein [Blumeria hordei DH14]SZF03819.1 unnamed protein product [Blumeria hordei]
MRLTSLAVILQSASFFVTTFATFTASHINEVNKGFACEGRLFMHEEYNRVEKMELTGPVNELGYTMSYIYDNLLQDIKDRRICAYQDSYETEYQFFELTNSWQSQLLHNGHLVHAYILVIDSYNRANAMIRRKTIFEGQRSPKVTYSICEIR